MKEVVREAGRTVRAALASWPGTIRLIALIVAVAAIAAIWTHYHL
jgi:hypothetical protein